MTKPLSEWAKWYFRIQLGYAADILNDPKNNVSVNGIRTKKLTLGVTNGDKIVIANREFIVDWSKDAI